MSCSTCESQHYLPSLVLVLCITWYVCLSKVFLCGLRENCEQMDLRRFFEVEDDVNNGTTEVVLVHL